jgi:hypothetical protein
MVVKNGTQVDALIGTALSTVALKVKFLWKNLFILKL